MPVYFIHLNNQSMYRIYNFDRLHRIFGAGAGEPRMVPERNPTIKQVYLSRTGPQPGKISTLYLFHPTWKESNRNNCAHVPEEGVAMGAGVPRKFKLRFAVWGSLTRQILSLWGMSHGANSRCGGGIVVFPRKLESTSPDSTNVGSRIDRSAFSWVAVITCRTLLV